MMINGNNKEIYEITQIRDTLTGKINDTFDRKKQRQIEWYERSKTKAHEKYERQKEQIRKDYE